VTRTSFGLRVQPSFNSQRLLEIGAPKGAPYGAERIAIECVADMFITPTLSQIARLARRRCAGRLMGLLRFISQRFTVLTVLLFTEQWLR
jgi:hypothetical protein